MEESPIDLLQVAEIEIIYRNKVKASERPQIKCSKDAYEVLIQSWDENKIDFVEQSKVILMNKANRVLGISKISTGGVSGTVMDPKVVFMAALKANACTIILAHNHPSGNLKPSEQDKKLTKKFIDGGKLLDIHVTDHLILTSEGYYSFGDDEVYKRNISNPS